MRSILLNPSDAWRTALMRGGPCGLSMPMEISPFLPEVRDVGPGYAIHETEEWVCLRCYGSAPRRVDLADAVLLIKHMRGCPLWSLVLAWKGVLVPEGLERAARVLAVREDRVPLTAVTWTRRVDQEFAFVEDEGFEQPPRVVAESTHCWALGGYPSGVLYWPKVESGGSPEQTVLALASPPVDIGELHAAWALATVCEARGLGTIVVMDDPTEAR